jgi:hypothetical protein
LVVVGSVQLITNNNGFYRITKKIKMYKLILLSAVFLISVCGFSQTDTSKNKLHPPDFDNAKDAKEDVEHYMNNANKNMPGKNDTLGSKKNHEKHPDGFMMLNGTMVKYNNGNQSLLTKEVTLSNGTVVMIDGFYKKKGAPKMMFKEREHMNLLGKISLMK